MPSTTSKRAKKRMRDLKAHAAMVRQRKAREREAEAAQLLEERRRAEESRIERDRIAAQAW